jgi:hypothetical protein
MGLNKIILSLNEFKFSGIDSSIYMTIHLISGKNFFQKFIKNGIKFIYSGLLLQADRTVEILILIYHIFKDMIN